MTSMNNKVFAIVGTLTFLASLGIFLFARWQTEGGAMKIPKVTVRQEQGYLRIFDVTFESQEQINTLIENDSRGTGASRRFLKNDDGDYGIQWLTRRDDEPVIRVDGGSNWQGFIRDARIAELLANDLIETLGTAGIEGVVSTQSIPAVRCQWFGDGVQRWEEIYFTYVHMVEGSGSRGNDIQYQLLREGSSLDCNEVAKVYQANYDAGIVVSPIVARVPNFIGLAEGLTHEMERFPDDLIR